MNGILIAMPAIAVIEKGIVIRMDIAPREHNPPHIHAERNEEASRFDFEGNDIDNKFPKQLARIVSDWIKDYRERLEANWKLSINGERPFRIE